MILPDTSIWVEYLRAGRSSQREEAQGVSPVEEFDVMLQQEQVLTCGPVMAELLAGARGNRRNELAEQLSAQPWIELKRADWLEVGHTAARLQEQGQTTPLLDIQIAVCAVKAKAELWTIDHDFERIAKVLETLPIRVFE